MEDGEAGLVAGLAGEFEAAFVEGVEIETDFVFVDAASEIETADTGAQACVVVDEAELDAAVGGAELQHMAEAGTGDGSDHGVVEGEPVTAFEKGVAPQGEVDVVEPLEHKHGEEVEAEFVPGVEFGPEKPGAELVAEAEHGFGVGVGVGVGSKPKVGGIAELIVVDLGNNFDKTADKGHIQDTVGSIADTAVDSTVQGLAQQTEPQRAPENSH